MVYVLDILGIVITILIIIAPNHLQDQTQGLSDGKERLITQNEKQLLLLIGILVIVLLGLAMVVR